MNTSEEFQQASASEKTALVVMEASRRLVGWTVYSGSVYQLSFAQSVIVSIEDSGTALTAAASIAAVTAGKYYLDRSARILYLRTSDSAHPSGKFIGCTFKLFFSNFPVAAPYDLSTGFDVEWLPCLNGQSEFSSELDNQNLIGFAIEGSGRIRLRNDQTYWGPKFDKWYFENQKVSVYSWNRGLPITEAKLIFRGKIQSKDYSTTDITFTVKDFVNELRAPIPLTDISEVTDVQVPPNLLTAKQRLLYGYVKGHVPTNIDQELPLTGYTITGTASTASASQSVTGSGTAFLAQLTPGDEVIFGNDTTTYTIESVTTDTACVLTEAYSGAAASGVAIRVKSSHPKRYANRVHLIAGHALKEPATTVAEVISLQKLELADATDFLAGDKVLISSEVFTILRVSGNRITLTTALGTAPAVSDPVVNLAVKNVYLNDRLLTYDRDYVYDAAAGTITLDPLAEFNVAPQKPLTGTLSFTNTSRSVTGSGTLLKNEVKPGDWVRRQGQSSWFEVLSIESNTAMTLRSAATYTSSGDSDLKNPEVYKEGQVRLTVECFGATENGAKTGTFIKTGAQMVKDILTRVGLSASVNTASFTVSQGDSRHKLSVTIPEDFSDTKVRPAREIINKINQSIFGSLYVNEDFEFEYSILSPKRPSGLVELIERDILPGWSIASDSARIAKTVRIKYLRKEFDYASLKASTLEATKTSPSAQYLARTTKEFAVETYLVDDTEAQVIANRWSFLMEYASSTLRVETKLQALRVAINDKIDVSHEKLYESIGGTAKRKIAGVQSLRKSPAGVEMELTDLSNAFSRCATITPDGVNSYEDATEDEKAYYGYITDDYGMQDGDPETFGRNLIW